MTVKFNASMIASFKTPDKRKDVFDSVVSGLALRLEPSGLKTWYAVYRINGKQHYQKIGTLQLFTLSQARDAARAIVGMAARGENPKADLQKSDEITLQALLDNYYEPWVTENRKSGEETCSVIKAHFKNLLKKRVCDLSVEDVEHWRKHYRETGVKNKKNNDLKAATCNRVVCTLRAMLNWAAHPKRKIITHNPIYGIEPLKETDSTQKTRYLSDEEMERLEATLCNRDQLIKDEKLNGYPLCALKGRFADHLHPMVLISLYTGIRWGSLAGLKWQDVDVEKKQLTIRPDNIKTEKLLILPMNATATETFKDWKEEIKSHGPNDLVFASKDGEKFDNVDKAFSSVLKDAGITNFTWNQMRHTFASRLVISGVDLYVVKELMGHTKISTTMRYAHLAPGGKLTAVELLDKKTKKNEATQEG